MAIRNNRTRTTKSRKAYTVGLHDEFIHVFDGNDKLCFVVYRDTHPETNYGWVVVEIDAKTGKAMTDGYDWWTRTKSLKDILITFCHVGYVNDVDVVEFFDTPANRLAA